MKVYKAITLEKDFVAFWASDAETISFYAPSDSSRGTYSTEPLAKYLAVKEHYKITDTEIDKFDEIVNAARHFLGGGRCLHIDRSKVEISTIEPGKYYPRIWRGYFGAYTAYRPINPKTFYGSQHIQSYIAATSLYDYLTDIFQNVEPATENLKTFSHKIRECLILACTEVETSWRAILEANTDPLIHKERYRTDDYIKLKKLMYLDQWAVVLKDYPSIGTLRPFAKWDVAAATKSLSWYDDYNAVKHHREVEFKKATLGNLLNAVAAVHVMQAAQWGPEVYSVMYENRSSPFYITEQPAIPVSEIYMPKLDGSGEFEPAFGIGAIHNNQEHPVAN